MDNKLKIISYLGKHKDKAFTMHELSKLTNIPYATFHRIIKQLTDVLIMETIGKSKTIKLNLKRPTIKSYLTIASEEEKKKYLEKQPIIRKIANEIKTKDIIVLFGSYAKNTHTKSSDIDLLIINKDGKKTISFSKYELLYKVKINPIFITKKEFRLMLKDEEENIGKQALKNHIILNNPEKFWEYVINGI
ncbi:MAG: nucleotidyltransferase domain-containing protein [Candidatus Woesearchaeota archaeon]